MVEQRETQALQSSAPPLQTCCTARDAGGDGGCGTSDVGGGVEEKKVEFLW